MEESLYRILDRYEKGEGNLISLLQDIQAELGYIPEEAVNWFSERLDLPPSRFFGVATFYAQFHLKPRGKNVISVCCGTACHVKGGSKIVERLQRDLGLTSEGETTPDGKFTVEVVRCVGACSLAPVVIVNDRVHSEMTVDSSSKLIKKLIKEVEGGGK